MEDPQPEMTDQNHDIAANSINNIPRFAVTTVPLREDSLETDEYDDENNAENTIGYSTHEAVPMTVFYRNESSHNHSKQKGKARPTLDQLRKGFEKNSPETQVNCSHSRNFALWETSYWQFYILF
jgi:hypothetical protein